MRLCDARILFVDDEPSLLDIFSYWLLGDDKSQLGATAEDGQEALEMMRAKTYDLLITDVNMPRLNGTSLIRHLAQAGIGIPAIIFVSGFGDVDQREMYGLGVEAFLAKPVTRETLIKSAECALVERSALWRKPFETSPRQSILIEASDFCEDAQNGCIVLGRGGFSAPYTAPVASGRVSFECRLAASGTQVTGQGFIRWHSKTEGTIGVEVSFLEENCRAAMAEKISRANPRAFIPSL